MSEAFNLNIVSVVLPNTLATNDIIPILQAPTTGHGGGISIQQISAMNYPASENQDASTALTLTGLRYSGAGTPALNGTVWTGDIGGTANPLLKGVPQIKTPSGTAQAYLAPGEWLFVKYVETGTTNPSNLTVCVHYLNGK